MISLVSLVLALFVWMIAYTTERMSISEAALLLGVLGVVTAFTGLRIENNHGQYKGYVTAVEQSGIGPWKGWNAYLKTELESSNEDVACINRDDQKLIERLQKASENKENLVFRYRGELQFPLGVCPGAEWMIVGIK